ncbi:helix-turn-helix transcriptional regulator [Rhodopseudomonas sp. P2A-2r]|uniref:helix-turn-helix transcriptional regulator n=1 Tax=unclassified Rhodopseudomonas TaxID=2638247 RepID=UPI002234DE1E|nr:helix-turn-helix transcriptional regulator [Rhodopseudomonas sp. P2A-2r]UZE48947.1 helix-turn-helix transcriptional regulator [Rhodopseudomonas sp. P2A-2r]
MTDANPLGAYLKDRRARLDPAAFGFSLQRRRTPGLRREEVAQRAHVSATWYTWLEQGRGGAPSADVLDRIARAMMLTSAEREHLFLLGLGRLPAARYQAPDGISPRLQRLLDTLAYSPAFVRTATWDVIAWNSAAAAVLTDYSKLPDGQRNILRLMFRDSRVRGAQPNWPSVARYVVASFRADVARAGAAGNVQSLVDELCATSPEFAAMWRDNDVQCQHGDGTKVLHHAIAGPLSMEFSSFAVDGRPDLNMVVYNPVTPADADKIRALLK